MKSVRVKKNNKIAKEITINISGAKNALLHLFFASLIPDSKTKFTNVPITILDYKNVKKILENIGTKIIEKNESVTIYNTNLSSNILEVSEEMTSKTRSSLMLLGSLLKKKGYVKIGFPGGCNFNGRRPFDIHLNGFKALGAKVKLTHNYIEVFHQKDKNSNFTMPVPSVGATINLIMYAVIGNSKTTLKNISIEPEVITIVKYLQKCGANIILNISNREINIIGVLKLYGCKFEIIFDRIQAMTYASMAYFYKTNVTITNINTKDTYNIQKPLEELTNAGAKWIYDPINRSIKFFGKDSYIKGINIVTAPFPLFPTDLQPIYAVMLFIAKTCSTIKDTIYPERINYIHEIKKMGLSINIENGIIQIKPIEDLSKIKPAIMNINDLRGGMACLMVGSLLDEFSTIHNAFQIFRGYNNLMDNMSHFMKIEVLNDTI